MLQAYTVKTYVSINGKPKKEIWNFDYGLTEEELPRIVTTTFSFQDCFDKQLSMQGITTGTTFFRKRPYVRIRYDIDIQLCYYNFDSITIERHYELDDITFNKLLNEYPADQCIQYLKEHGITTCPMNF